MYYQLILLQFLVISVYHISSAVLLYKIHCACLTRKELLNYNSSQSERMSDLQDRMT